MTETDGPRTDAWPIPARQSLFVQFTGMGDAVLFDMTGRAVRSYPLADPVTELDVSSLARGTYLLRLRDRSTSAVHPMKVVLE